jgi:hypothetical protein
LSAFWPRPQDALPVQPQASEPELDVYGLPVQDRPATGRTHLLVIACLIRSLVSVGLAVTDTWVAYRSLAGYMVFLGILSGFLAIVLEWFVEQKKQQLGVMGRIVAVGGRLGLLGSILLMVTIWTSGATGRDRRGPGEPRAASKVPRRRGICVDEDCPAVQAPGRRPAHELQGSDAGRMGRRPAGRAADLAYRRSSHAVVMVVGRVFRGSAGAAARRCDHAVDCLPPEIG